MATRDSFNRILSDQVVSSGVITTFAGVNGGGKSQKEGYATSTLLSQPQGVFVSPNGDVYVADSGNGKIRKVSCHFSLSFRHFDHLIILLNCTVHL